MATFRHVDGIPAHVGGVGGRPLFLCFNATNHAWVISMELGSLDAIAYAEGNASCPEKLTSAWLVADASGYAADPALRLQPATAAAPLEPPAPAPLPVWQPPHAVPATSMGAPGTFDPWGLGPSNAPPPPMAQPYVPQPQMQPAPPPASVAPLDPWDMVQAQPPASTNSFYQPAPPSAAGPLSPSANPFAMDNPFAQPNPFQGGYQQPYQPPQQHQQMPPPQPQQPFYAPPQEYRPPHSNPFG